MIAYVETNFVLELALLQEEHHHCLEIVELGKRGSIRLVIAAFSLAEPYATLTRRHNERRQLRNRLENEMKQLARTQSYQAHKSAMSDITSLLLRSTT